jgi:hypothetical protein
MQWRSQLSVCCGEGFACVAEAHGNRLAAKMFETRAAMAAPPMKSEHSLMAARPEPAVCALFLAPVWRGRTRGGAANRMAGGLDALKAQVGVAAVNPKKLDVFPCQVFFADFACEFYRFTFANCKNYPRLGWKSPVTER